MVEFNGTRFRAHIYTATAVPALFWIEDNRGFAFFELGMRRSTWHTSTQALHPLQISGSNMTGLVGVQRLGKAYTFSCVICFLPGTVLTDVSHSSLLRSPENL